MSISLGSPPISPKLRSLKRYFPQARVRVLKFEGTEFQVGTDMNIVKDKTFDIIVSRALANINLLLEFSQNLSNQNTKLIFLKGKKIYEEIDEAKKYWKFNYELIDSITSSEGKIIIINDFKKLDLF